MGAARVIGRLTIVLLFFGVVGFPLMCNAKEAAVKATPQKQGADISQGKAVLRVSASSGKSVSVELANTVPVRALQFTVTGVKMSEVRTTSRTPGFLAKFNEENGAVIVLSISADLSAPGKGSIAEIICDKPSAAQLSEIKIAGKDRESLQ